MVPLIWLAPSPFGQKANKENSAMTKFRHLIWMLIATAGLILSTTQSQAQLRSPDVGDQPGARSVPVRAGAPPLVEHGSPQRAPGALHDRAEIAEN